MAAQWLILSGALWTYSTGQPGDIAWLSPQNAGCSGTTGTVSNQAVGLTSATLLGVDPGGRWPLPPNSTLDHGFVEIVAWSTGGSSVLKITANGRTLVPGQWNVTSPEAVLTPVHQTYSLRFDALPRNITFRSTTVGVSSAVIVGCFQYRGLFVFNNGTGTGTASTGTASTGTASTGIANSGGSSGGSPVVGGSSSGATTGQSAPAGRTTAVVAAVATITQMSALTGPATTSLLPAILPPSRVQDGGSSAPDIPPHTLNFLSTLAIILLTLGALVPCIGVVPGRPLPPPVEEAATEITSLMNYRALPVGYPSEQGTALFVVRGGELEVTLSPTRAITANHHFHKHKHLSTRVGWTNKYEHVCHSTMAVYARDQAECLGLMLPRRLRRDKISLGIPLKLSWFLDVAKAVGHLHKNQVVHGALTLDCVWCHGATTRNSVIRVSGYATGLPPTHPWQAHDPTYDSVSDIWDLGHLALSLFKDGEHPVPGETHLPTSLTDDFCALITACCTQKRSHRPSIESVIDGARAAVLYATSISSGRYGGQDDVMWT